MSHWIDTHRSLNKFEVSFIRGLKLFRDLDDCQFESLIAESKAVKLGRGESLYTKNQAALHFFVLIEGRIKLTRTSVDGGEKVIDIVKPGQIFAESALLAEDQTYSEDARAIGDVLVVAISTRAYFSFLKKSPGLCLTLMEIISQHVQWLVEEIDRITLHNAAYRLVSYLLEEVESSDQGAGEFQLNIPKTIIASRLSITPETLSRILKGLASQNLIDYHNGGFINLKDIPRLRGLLLSEVSDKFYG